MGQGVVRVLFGGQRRWAAFGGLRRWAAGGGRWLVGSGCGQRVVGGPVGLLVSGGGLRPGQCVVGRGRWAAAVGCVLCV